MSRPTKLLAISALATTAIATAAALAAPSSVHMLSCSGKPLVEPRGTVVLACADANTLIKGTDWTSWSASGAVGTTDFGLNLCTPYCAASPISYFPHSTIRLSAVRKTAHGELFTRALITYRRHGASRTFTAGLAS